jgi:hypothetical protein
MIRLSRDPHKDPYMNLRTLLPLFVALTLVGGCSKPENKAAKERLSKPEPPDPLIAKSEEVIMTGNLADDDKVRDRVNRMGFAEVARRLGSLKLHTVGRLSFNRAGLNVDSSEVIDVVQSPDGDFSVAVKTGDGSTQDLVFANGVLFLKNNNGRWRASRDPVGERNNLLQDSTGVWRSFYDLFEHAASFTPRGETSYQGRSAHKFGISVDDKSDEARGLGAEDGPRPRLHVPDAGTADAGNAPVVDEKGMQEWVSNRVRKWRKRARPAGGSGEILVDRETGVLLQVRFKGDLVVGDGRAPARLHVEIEHDVSDVDRDLQVVVPKDAIDEVVRKKWPVAPRELLEEEGIVAPLPKEEKGKDKAAAADKPASEEKAAPAEGTTE